MRQCFAKGQPFKNCCVSVLRSWRWTPKMGSSWSSPRWVVSGGKLLWKQSTRSLRKPCTGFHREATRAMIPTLPDMRSCLKMSYPKVQHWRTCEPMSCWGIHPYRQKTKSVSWWNPKGIWNMTLWHLQSECWVQSSFHDVQGQQKQYKTKTYDVNHVQEVRMTTRSMMNKSTCQPWKHPIFLNS